MSTTQLQPVADMTHVAEARRLATQMGSALGFSIEAASDLGIIVTELAKNLVTHAGGGQLLFRALSGRDGEVGLETLSVDSGPGMANVSECLRDGFSTRGTPGNGLGAVRRLSRTFDIYSKPQQGAVILSQVWASRSLASRTGAVETVSRTKIVVGAVNVPVKGEKECGDSWAVRESPGTTSMLVIDGLGHGPLAAQAATAGVKAFEGAGERTAREHISMVNDALRPTRGAAGAVSLIDHAAGTLTYCGVGNISAAVIADDTERHLVSHNGTLGHDTKTLREFAYPWTSSSLLVMTSDGLTSRWSLAPYAGIRLRHPSVIAGVLFRDFCRGRDDSTVVVLGEGEVAR